MTDLAPTFVVRGYLHGRRRYWSGTGWERGHGVYSRETAEAHLAGALAANARGRYGATDVEIVETTGPRVVSATEAWMAMVRGD